MLTPALHDTFCHVQKNVDTALPLSSRTATSQFQCRIAEPIPNPSMDQHAVAAVGGMNQMGDMNHAAVGGHGPR